MKAAAMWAGGGTSGQLQLCRWRRPQSSAGGRLGQKRRQTRISRQMSDTMQIKTPDGVSSPQHLSPSAFFATVTLSA